MAWLDPSQVSSWPEADALGELVLLRSIRHTSGCTRARALTKAFTCISTTTATTTKTTTTTTPRSCKLCEGSRPMMQELQVNRAEFSNFTKSVNSNADVLSMRLLTSGHIALGGSSTVRRTKSWSCGFMDSLRLHNRHTNLGTQMRAGWKYRLFHATWLCIPISRRKLLSIPKSFWISVSACGLVAATPFSTSIVRGQRAQVTSGETSLPKTASKGST